jgi:hypothetical protein
MQRCNLNIASKYEYIFMVILRIYSIFYIYLISVVKLVLFLKILQFSASPNMVSNYLMSN